MGDAARKMAVIVAPDVAGYSARGEASRLHRIDARRYGNGRPAARALPCRMNATDRRRFLRTCPVLGELPAVRVRKVCESAAPIQVPAGKQVLGNGSPCTHYPLLIEGTIRVSKLSPEGREILLYRLNPGERCVMTVLALLGEVPYPAIGTAETKLMFFGIPRSTFVHLLLESRAFRSFVFPSLSQRLAHLMALVDDVAFRRVDQRLASRLLLHSEPIATTHQMLADDLGTSREVVTRILEGFQQSGMISLGRKQIDILDRPALNRLQ